MWGHPNNQEVGLEAAILERVRNSSLVEWPCADNGPGLKSTAEAAERPRGLPARAGAGVASGRGAFPGGEAPLERGVERVGSENAGMSSDKAHAKCVHRKPEGSDGRKIRVGLVGPKPRA